MPATTALKCFIAALDQQSRAANQWVGPARVDALWRDPTAYRSSGYPTSVSPFPLPGFQDDRYHTETRG